jgi:hypothetical protein
MLRRKALEVENSFEVIKLVLKSLSHETFTFNLDTVSLEGETFCHRVRVALARVGQAGNRKAPFRHILGLAPHSHQSRIQEITHRPIDVVAKGPETHTNLIRSNTSPARDFDGIQKVSNQFSTAGRQKIHGVRGARQNGVPKEPNGTLGH